MSRKKMTPTARRNHRATVNLEIELPVLSDEAAAAMADVLVQLYHRFEASYYAQILSHHAERALSIDLTGTGRSKPDPDAELF